MFLCFNGLIGHLLIKMNIALIQKGNIKINFYKKQICRDPERQKVTGLRLEGRVYFNFQISHKWPWPMTIS